MSVALRAEICDCKLKDVRVKKQLLRRVPVERISTAKCRPVFLFLKWRALAENLLLANAFRAPGWSTTCLWRAPGRRDRGVGSGWEGERGGLERRFKPCAGLNPGKRRRHVNETTNIQGDCCGQPHSSPSSSPTCTALTPHSRVDVCRDVRLSWGHRAELRCAASEFFCVVSRKGI